MRRLLLVGLAVSLLVEPTRAADSSFNGIFPANGQAVGAKRSTDGKMVPFTVDGAGALQIAGSISSTPPTSVVSAGNSTTTPLGGGATFTGTSASILGYAGVAVSVFANVSSSATGLQIQFSQDGTNWNDAVVASFTSGGASPNDGQVWMTGARGQYVRVVYTNGAGAQATFRLQTILLAASPAGDTVDVAETISANNHATVTKGVIVGKTTGGGGGFVDVKVNPSGTLTVQSAAEGTTGATAPTTAIQVAGQEPGGNLQALITHGTGTDAEATRTTGALETDAHLRLWNGATFDRARGTIANGMAVDVTRVQGNVAARASKAAAAPLSSAVSVTTSATLLPASALTNRTSLCVYNNGSATLFVGTSGVTTSTGFPVPAGGAFCDDVGSQPYYGIVASGTVEARVLEN